MTHVERDIAINNALNVVYEYAAIPESLPDWYAGVVGVNPDGVWPAEGGQIGVTYEAAGFNFDLTATVLTYDPPYQFTFQMDGMVNGTATWTYSEDGGITYVNASFEYELPGGVFGQIADKLVVEKMNIELGEASLANLKAICEG